MSVYVKQQGIISSYLSSNSWIVLNPIEQSIAQKISKHGIPLKDWNINIYRGVLTGLNEAFVIDGATKDRLIDLDPKSAEIIRPILRGRDVQRYGYTFADLWLIATFPSKKYDINQYPAIKNYLLSFGMEKLEQTGSTYSIGGKVIKSRKRTNNQWFETQDTISYWDDFSNPKMIWKRIGSLLRFCFDTSNTVCLDSTCFATGEGVAFLTAILNTTLGNYLFANSPKTGTGDLLISVQAIEPIKIPLISNAEQTKFEQLLHRIISCIQDGKDYSAYEIELENKVYALYDLTPEERKYVEQVVTQCFRQR